MGKGEVAWREKGKGGRNDAKKLPNRVQVGVKAGLHLLLSLHSVDSCRPLVREDDVRSRTMKRGRYGKESP